MQSDESTEELNSRTSSIDCRQLNSGASKAKPEFRSLIPSLPVNGLPRYECLNKQVRIAEPFFAGVQSAKIKVIRHVSSQRRDVVGQRLKMVPFLQLEPTNDVISRMSLLASFLSLFISRLLAFLLFTSYAFGSIANKAP